LRHVEFEPGFLNRMRHIRRKPFDSDDLLLLGHRADRHAARACCDPIDMHGAGAALSDAATVFGAGQADLFADDPEQGRIGLDLHLTHRAVDRQSCHGCPLSNDLDCLDRL
jgi:hypothetical protein